MHFGVTYHFLSMANPQELIVLGTVPHHRSVAWFEDMQREFCPWKNNAVWDWENRYLGHDDRAVLKEAKLLLFSMDAFTKNIINWL